MQLIKFLSDKNDHENNDNTLKLTYKWAKKCPADLHGRCPPGCVIGNSKRVRGIPLMPAIIAMELMLYLLREDAEQADTDSFGTGRNLFYVGAVAGWAVRQ